MRFSIAVLLGVACSLPAQTKTPSTDARQSGAPAGTSQQYNDLPNYDFNGALQKLRGQTTPAIPPLRTNPPSVAAGAASKPAGAPPDWRAPHVELNATAASAASVADAWESSFNLPTPGADGRVLYTFGEGMPVVVCAPLRVCALELEPGEHIQSPPQIGDGRRWEVTPVASGSGLTQTALLIIKPIEAGLDTDLVVPTDRRTYVVRLVSDATRYISTVAFRYPANDPAKWSAFQAQQDAAARSAEEQRKEKSLPDTGTGMTPNALDHLYFDYKVDGDPDMKPVRVLDDGQHTYIFYPNDGRFREVPTLMIDVSGKTELVNFRVDGNRYVVDRLFDKGVLLLGVGKKQKKVTITRAQDYASSANPGGRG
ncbi:P-type conjugative transfer protein TrbG [Occallatibacter riparius]|uniref:P-type conjugative transfer protein TrbG n=1 Tax=Occallatibacter riparius TaxID=1002689 RepID=A0A9J7BRC8_9BACT|nr:P-type conjugative transfer protein TrbG [Occallatibacter riparius]UWZ85137.1 P-type conjugative transfer protein TrbG [Occallatibacter riparius]